jgi:hypothetical protein
MPGAGVDGTQKHAFFFAPAAFCWGKRRGKEPSVIPPNALACHRQQLQHSSPTAGILPPDAFQPSPSLQPSRQFDVVANWVFLIAAQHDLLSNQISPEPGFHYFPRLKPPGRYSIFCELRVFVRGEFL